jgi:hypothetical protein
LVVRLALCLLAGCLPELDDAVVVRGRHVTVYADPAIPVCERAVADADRFIEDSSAMLGIPPRPIDYYLFDGPTHCGLGRTTNVSCVINGTVYANVWIHFHELVHAVDDTYPPALFVEGFAEALSIPSEAARRDAAPRANARLDLETTAFRAGPPAENYRVAGDFVRYLLEQFGAVRYRAFASSLLSLSDLITIRRVFEQVYGVSLADVIARWRVTDPGSSTLIVPVDVTECHDPISPVGPETWAIEDIVPDACTSGRTANGTPYVQPHRRYGFEVTEPGLFAIHVAGGEGGSAVRSCVDHTVHEHASSADSMRFLTLPLHAGRHAIELGEEVQAWRVARLGEVGETCETAPTFTAPASDVWQLEFRGRPTTWIRIAYDGARAFSVSATVHSPVFVCTGECDDQRCRPLQSRAALEPRPGPLYIKLAGHADWQSVTIATSDGS